MRLTVKQINLQAHSAQKALFAIFFLHAWLALQVMHQWTWNRVVNHYRTKTLQHLQSAAYYADHVLLEFWHRALSAERLESASFAAGAEFIVWMWVNDGRATNKRHAVITECAFFTLSLWHYRRPSAFVACGQRSQMLQVNTHRRLKRTQIAVKFSPAIDEITRCAITRLRL